MATKQWCPKGKHAVDEVRFSGSEGFCRACWAYLGDKIESWQDLQPGTVEVPERCPKRWGVQWEVWSGEIYKFHRFTPADYGQQCTLDEGHEGFCVLEVGS